MIHLHIDIPPKHPTSSKRCIIDNYELGDILGTGANGEVRLATHIITHKQYAAKIVFYDDLNQISQAKNEIHLYKTMNHTHLISCIHINQHAIYIKSDGSKHSVILIVMELATGGDLLTHIQSHKRLSEDEARHFFHQMMTAVSYLHQHGYAHRDLKPENLLLNSSHTHLQLADFGFTTHVADSQHIQCGTPGYMAPEIWMNPHIYDATKIDIWACGVILFSMIAGAAPYTPPSLDNIHHHQPHHDWWLNKLETHQYDLFWYAHERNGMNFSHELRDLIEQMLEWDVEKRMNIDEILNHPWMIQQSQDECEESYHIQSTPSYSSDVDDVSYLTKEFSSHLLFQSSLYIQSSGSYSSEVDDSRSYSSEVGDVSCMNEIDFL